MPRPARKITPRPVSPIPSVKKVTKKANKTGPKPKQPTLDVDSAALGARVANLEGEIGGLRKTSDDILAHLKQLSGEPADDATPDPSQPLVQVSEIDVNSVHSPSAGPYRRRLAPRAKPYSRPEASAAARPHVLPARHDEVYDLLNTAAIPAPSRHLPVSSHGGAESTVSSQVQTLLSTAQQLTSIKGRPTHPHHYVFRGPTRVKTTLRSLAPAEYLWGLFRLMKDPQTDDEVRPAIATHIYQVIEDAKDYSWGQVRDWSEEVLTKLGEDLFTWFDESEIKSLRDCGARFKTGRIHGGDQPADRAAESKPKSRPPIRPQVSRPDVPCPAWNSVQGCSKPDGHIENNTPQGHHCKFCRKHMNGVNYHPKVGCRNRGRMFAQTSTQPTSQPTFASQPTFRQQAGYDRPAY